MEPTITSWESLLHIPSQTEGTNFEPLRSSLLPAPLRLHSTPASSQPQIPSPPGSPSPTVLVSLRTIEPAQVSTGQLSLHEYRKNLSRPLPDPGVVAPTPGRTLKRKPKATNLNRIHTQRTPPSPPLTPPQGNTFPAFTFSQDPTVPPPEHLNQSNDWENLDEPRSASTALGDINTPFTPITTPYGPESAPIQHIFGETRQNSGRGRLTSLRDRLRKIPGKLTFHNKSVSDSALPTSSTNHGKIYRHRGVSFEILNPNHTPVSNNSNFALVSSMDDSRGASTQTPSTRRVVHPILSPSPHSRRRSLSVGAEARRTPSRALYEDLPTAYSSIASRVANRRSRFLTSSPDLTSSDYWAQSSPPTDISRIEREYIDTGPLHRKRQLGTIDPFAPPVSFLNLSSDDSVPPTPLWERTKTLRSQNSPILPTFANWHPPNFYNTQGRVGKPGTHRKSTSAKSHRPAVNIMVMRNQKPFFLDHEGFIGSRSPTSLKFGYLPEERRRFWQDCVRNSFKMGLTIYSSPAATATRSIPLFERRGLMALKPLVVPQFVDGDDTLPRVVASHPHFSRPTIPAQLPKSNSYQDSTQANVNKGFHPRMGKRASGVLSSHSYVPAPVDTLSSGNDNVLTDELSVKDFGPGSSQTSSSVHLSQYAGSSLALRSHPPHPSVMSFGSGDSKEGNPFFSTRLRENRSIDQTDSDPTREYVSHYNRPSLYSNNNREHDGDDWETIAGSQQFTGASGNRLVHMESGSSLADYSSFGSLANRALGSKSSLYHTRKRFSIGGSQSTRNSRLSQGRSKYAHSPPRTSTRNSLASHPAAGSGMRRAIRYGSLGDAVPALKASTSKQPAPRLGSSPPYRHPAPLNDSHPNPFQSTPPSISEKKRRVLQKPERLGGSNTGLISSIRNSKLAFSNNHYNTSIGPVGGDIPRHKGVGGSLKAREESSAWGTISSFNTSRPHSPSPQGVVTAHPMKDGNSSQLSSLHHSNNITSNTPAIAPATDQDNSNDALHLASSTGRPHPDTLPSQSEPQQVYDKRDDSSVHAPSCTNSTENLIPRASVKFPPGSLYLSIRSARGRAPKNRGNETSANNSVSSKRETLLVSDDSIKRPLGLNRRESWTPRSLIAAPAHTYTSHNTFRNERNRPKKPDEILRERLSRIETTPISSPYHEPSASENGYTVRSYTSPIPEQPSSTWNPRSSLSRQYTVRRGTVSPFASIDEESAVTPTPTPLPTWHESANSRYTFSEPPRLISNHHSRHTKFPSASATGEITAQRRQGQQLIILFSLAAPLGWFLVFFIGFGGSLANFLIQWRSRGFVREFNEKERYVARRLGVVYAIFSFIFALVLLVVLLLV